MLARAALRSAPYAVCRARECRARVAASAFASSSSAADDLPSTPPTHATFVSRTLSSTERIARALAVGARVGDIVCLHGDVGAGKSVLSRAFVRQCTGDQTMEVPSPTFLLQQVYDVEGGCAPVHHFDLYRLSDVSQTIKLDLAHSFSNAVSLIEWAERLGDDVPENRLDVFLAIDGSVGNLENVTDVAPDDDTDCGYDDDDDVDPDFVDSQPRILRFEGRGEYWEGRVEDLAKTLANEL